MAKLKWPAMAEESEWCMFDEDINHLYSWEQPEGEVGKLGSYGWYDLQSRWVAIWHFREEAGHERIE